MSKKKKKSMWKLKYYLSEGKVYYLWLALEYEYMLRKLDSENFYVVLSYVFSFFFPYTQSPVAMWIVKGGRVGRGNSVDLCKEEKTVSLNHVNKKL